MSVENFNVISWKAFYTRVIKLYQSTLYGNTSEDNANMINKCKNLTSVAVFAGQRRTGPRESLFISSFIADMFLNFRTAKT